MTAPKAQPRRLPEGAAELAQVLDLIRRSFAAMEGRIDPPSSMHRLTLQTLSQQAHDGEIWCLGDPVRACIFLTPKDDCLYLGKLATDAEFRGQGLARSLVDLAAQRARDLGFDLLELQVRVELVENQSLFAHLGFDVTDRTAHPGYGRPTSVTMRRQL